MASRKQSQLAKRAIAMETGAWEGKNAYYRSTYQPWLDKHHALERAFKVFRPLIQHNIEPDDLHVLAKLHHELGFSYLRSWVKPDAERETTADSVLHFAEAVRLLTKLVVAPGAKPADFLHELYRWNIHLGEAVDAEGRRPDFAVQLYKHGLHLFTFVNGKSQQQFAVEHVKKRIREIEETALRAPPNSAPPDAAMMISQALPGGLGLQPLFHSVDALHVPLPEPLQPADLDNEEENDDDEEGEEAEEQPRQRLMLEAPAEVEAEAEPEAEAGAEAEAEAEVKVAAEVVVEAVLEPSDAPPAAAAPAPAPQEAEGMHAAPAGVMHSVPAWVERACELLPKGKITVAMVAHQARRAAARNQEIIDQKGFDILLEMQEERGLSAERIDNLQDELNL